jgi:(2Fe-2S) ferredoxin
MRLQHPTHMPLSPEPARIFVCVKLRSGDKSSCAGQGSLELVKSLRAGIAAQGEVASHIDVRPCGCLDLCKKGPVVAVVTGKRALKKRPPKKLKKSSLLWKRAAADEAGRMIREVQNQSLPADAGT